jgi:hypothetical protein
MSERVTLFRMHAVEAECKAVMAKTDEHRREWKIIARDWNIMAEREERRSSVPVPLDEKADRDRS